MAFAAPAGARVDWAEGVLRATGSGPPDLKAVNPAHARLAADRSARADAVRGLLEAAKPLALDGERTVQEAIASDPPLRTALEAAVEKALHVTATRMFSDHGVEIDVALPLGAIEAALAGTAAAKPSLNERGKPKHTGLVVDALGLKVSPHLAPRIAGEDGALLYAPGALTDEARRASGAAAWVKSVSAAKKHARAGRNPLVVKAKSASAGEIVLRAADAKELSESNNAFLAEGRVVIVTR